MLRKLVRSFGYALQGVFYAFQTQRNALIQVYIGLAVIALAAWLRVSPLEWAILLLTIGIVLSAETMNTAIERTVDLLSPEKRDSAKHAKDAAAGAVLIVSIAAAIVGLIILAPKLWMPMH